MNRDKINVFIVTYFFKHLNLLQLNIRYALQQVLILAKSNTQVLLDSIIMWRLHRHSYSARIHKHTRETNYTLAHSYSCSGKEKNKFIHAQIGRGG